MFLSICYLHFLAFLIIRNKKAFFPIKDLQRTHSFALGANMQCLFSFGIRITSFIDFANGDVFNWISWNDNRFLFALAPKSFLNNPLLTFFFLQAMIPCLGESFATLIFNLCFIWIPPLSRIFVAVYPLLTIWRFKGVFDHPVFWKKLIKFSKA